MHAQPWTVLQQKFLKMTLLFLFQSSEGGEKNKQKATRFLRLVSVNSQKYWRIIEDLSYIFDL